MQDPLLHNRTLATYAMCCDFATVPGSLRRIVRPFIRSFVRKSDFDEVHDNDEGGR